VEHGPILKRYKVKDENLRKISISAIDLLIEINKDEDDLI
jgi:hypothetical protein